MRIPRQPLSLAGGLVCDPTVVDLEAWQAHLIKHPLGVGALMDRARRQRAWNEEGWDRTEPRVVDLAERRALVEAIAQLEEGGARCQVARLGSETYGGEVPDDWEACYRCPGSLMRRCAGLTSRVGERYRQATEAALRLLTSSEGQEIARTELTGRIYSLVMKAELLAGLAVLSVGLAPSGRAIVRINNHDGVRVELFRDGHHLRWRTTYREPRSGAALVSFLLEGASLPADGGIHGPLSGRYVVPRQWLQGTSK